MSRDTTAQRLPLSEQPLARAMLANDPCAYCGKRAEALDHIVPESAGGGTTIANLTAACHSCNASKRVATLLGFLGWMTQAADRATAELMLDTSRRWRALGG